MVTFRTGSNWRDGLPALVPKGGLGWAVVRGRRLVKVICAHGSTWLALAGLTI